MHQDIAATTGPYGYGLATFIKVKTGAREAFIEVMGDVARAACQSPGCAEYIISRVPGDPDGVFVTEYWRNAEDQRGALQLPAIIALIDRCSTLIDRFEQKPLEPIA